MASGYLMENLVRVELAHGCPVGNEDFFKTFDLIILVASYVHIVHVLYSVALQ
ncbi:hypothetical protein Dsin_018217 [Dipteronia sinensis]|uniref:Uncharacterized protein n=1 Tax=Dipteronia sinensis TaxID=43782 RepID=A0AAE0A538_9ROSI|nr:hypothetical protein Dsin_018217 [Dipteronia sinensis]